MARLVESPESSMHQQYCIIFVWHAQLSTTDCFVCGKVTLSYTSRSLPVSDQYSPKLTFLAFCFRVVALWLSSLSMEGMSWTPNVFRESIHGGEVCGELSILLGFLPFALVLDQSSLHHQSRTWPRGEWHHWKITGVY